MNALQATADLFWLSGDDDPHPSAEALLVRAVLDGNRDLFGRLYAKYAPLVNSILLARVPRTDVEDLVQDVFVTAIDKLHTLRNPDAFGAWIATIARNRAIAFYRESRPTVEVTEDLCTYGGKDRTEGDALELLRIIQMLPPAYRETLIMRLAEGMTGPEIALRTGLTAASVRVNLHRGMKLLKERLKIKKTKV